MREPNNAEGVVAFWGAKLRGWLAHQFGHSRKCNPHERRSGEWHDWDAGWCMSRRGDPALKPIEIESL